MVKRHWLLLREVQCKCSVAGGGCGSQARVEEGSTVQMFLFSPSDCHGLRLNQNNLLDRDV